MNLGAESDSFRPSVASSLSDVLMSDVGEKGIEYELRLGCI